MDTANQPERKRTTSLRRNRIARVVFQAAESMGMPDRKLVERLTAQVIKRLEQSPPPTRSGIPATAATLTWNGTSGAEASPGKDALTNRF